VVVVVVVWKARDFVPLIVVASNHLHWPDWKSYSMPYLWTRLFAWIYSPHCGGDVTRALL
jgi:hypothetical protein